jgi:hypothetical protein
MTALRIHFFGGFQLLFLISRLKGPERCSQCSRSKPVK